MMGGGMIIWIVLLLVIVLLGYKFFPYKQNNSHSNLENKQPEDILKERYARGEINKEEFDEKKKELLS